MKSAFLICTDVIPLHEITCIQKMEGVAVADLSTGAGRLLLEIQVTAGGSVHKNMLEILFKSASGDNQQVSTEMEKEKLRGVFNQMDTDQSGFLSRGELNEFFSKAGYTANEVGNLLAQIDADNNGEISFDELWAFRQRNLGSYLDTRKSLKVSVVRAENILNTDGTKLETGPRQNAKNFWDVSDPYAR